MGATVIFGLAMAGPAFALPFIGKKQPPAAQPAAKPAAQATPPASSAPPATAAKTAPAAPARPGAAMDIKGFRSAAFGMTPAQVKAAIAADFGASTKLQEGANPADGTRFILASVDHLDPGPGAAQIGYVFGAASKTLATINVVWTTHGEATAPQRAAIAQAGQQIAAYFQSGPPPAKAAPVVAIGTNGLQLYAAVDHKNAAVEVSIDGVAYETGEGAKKVTSPPPKGPATLRVAYLADVDKPDTKALKPGSF